MTLADLTAQGFQGSKDRSLHSFCDTIIKSGYSAGVYANHTWLNYYIDGAGLGKKYPIWLAHYTSNTNYDQRMDMWQYSGSGTVSGISAYTDVNVWYSGKLPLYVSDLISVKTPPPPTHLPGMALLTQQDMKYIQGTSLAT